jgi:6-pyruvoyltetrahydropterin/6-carboxytetrahydropterin synthase
VGQIIEDPGSPDDGMLIDFADLKKFMTEEIHDVLDHGFIVYKGDVDMQRSLCTDGSIDLGDPQGRFGWKVIIFPYVPTAENIARWAWERLEPRIKGHFRDNLRLDEVHVWETPTSVAYYYGPNYEYQFGGNE